MPMFLTCQHTVRSCKQQDLPIAKATPNPTTTPYPTPWERGIETTTFDESAIFVLTSFQLVWVEMQNADLY